MITEIALKHFDQIWALFDQKMFDFRGSMFLIDPFEQYFPRRFAEELTQETARDTLRLNLVRWGEIEQREHEIEVVSELRSPDGLVYPKTQFKDPDVLWARRFVVTAFYNICSLATYKMTIEELIYMTWQQTTEQNPSATGIHPFHRLLGISNSFLLAEWADDLFRKAIANDDRIFFKKMQRWLIEDTAVERFDTARNWLGVILLWHLGGKDIKPRRTFMNLLQQKGLLSKDKDESVFNAELRKFHLL